MKTIATAVWVVICILASSAASQDPQHAPMNPLVRVVDLDLGETLSVRLCDGRLVEVKLVALDEQRDSIRNAVRKAMVTVEVDGVPADLVSATYRLPTIVNGVRIDCSITRGYNSNGSPESWALDKDARLRLWPADSPLVRPETFTYPVKQRWFATLTQMGNEPTYVDGCEDPSRKKIYYHNGLDIGGCEGLTEVIAATDGLVVSSGLDVLPEHRENTPVRPRYDVVYIRDIRGWYYRYSHLKSIDASIKPGRVIQMGDPVGLLGKEGGSGGWSHLHFGISAMQPSGRYGEQEGYAFLWESYVRQYRPKLIAVARPHYLIRAGESVQLDGSRSWSVSDSIQQFRWQFVDGSSANGAKVTRAYPNPGCYGEILKITDGAGNTAYDFATVQVIDPEPNAPLPPMIHAAYWPTQNIYPGDSVTFKVRSFGTTHGKEIWDFGDGTAPVQVQSDGNKKMLDPNGYAITEHVFASPGDYIVRVERADSQGVPAIGHLHVHVAKKTTQ